MGSTFGKIFKVATFGESHGAGIGVIIEGCPAGLEVDIEDIQKELDRRKPGQSKITTPRKEEDKVQIQSGIFEGVTLGTPISLYVPNTDARSGAYNAMKDLYRPSHADYTYEQRYGHRDWRGGGRASNRETTARVAAGAIAKLLIEKLAGVETLSWVEQIHLNKASIDIESVTYSQVENNMVRCPDETAAEKMVEAITAAKNNGDSLGGVICFRVRNCPAGLGAPVFDKLTAELAHGLMSIPATRDISFGLGRKAVELTGWEHNDPMYADENKEVHTETNYAGGIVGGISNGEMIYGNLSFKPTATINREQRTVTKDREEVYFKARGRHDPCVLPRAVPVVEAMINLTIADHLLRYAVSNVDSLKKIF